MVEIRSNDAYRCALLILVCFVFSMPGIFHRSIWYDEAITLISAAGQPNPVWPRSPLPAADYKQCFIGNPSLTTIIQNLKNSDIHPPIYFLSLAKWRQLFGASIESARLLSLGYFIIGILFLYGLLRMARIENPLVPVLMYTISSSAIHLSGEARAYSLANTLVIIGASFAYASTCCNSLTERKNIIYSSAIAVILALAFLTNYLALFPALAIFTWFLWQHFIYYQKAPYDRSKRVFCFTRALSLSLLLY